METYIPKERELSPDEFVAHPHPAEWLVRWVMSRAVDRFGGMPELIFNTACFQREWRDYMGVGSWLHGYEVREMLQRQGCAELLSGGSHWKMLPSRTTRGPSIFERPKADAPPRARGIA